MQLNSLHIFLAMAVAQQQQLPQVKVFPIGMHNNQAASVPAMCPVLQQQQQHECCMHHEMPV